MFAPLKWWSSKARRPRRQATRSWRAPRLPLSLECLEDRTLPAGHTLPTATLLSFNGAARPVESAQVADFLAAPGQEDFYRVSLSAGDRVTASVDAQHTGSALDSLLRVFDAGGRQIAFNDNFNGRDPQLTFQAAADGDYFFRVASANATTGVYELTLSRESGAELAPDLVSSGLSVDHDVIASGDALTITYTIENRGGTGTDTPFAVNFRLSQGSSPGIAVATRTVSPLGPGESFTETFTVKLAAFNINTNLFNFRFPGLPAPPPGPTFRPGPAFLGIRVDAGDDIAESDEANNSGQHQGTDLAAVTVVQPHAAVEPVNDFVRIAVGDGTLSGNDRITGTVGPGDEDTFRFRPSQDGLLTIRVVGDGVDTRSVLSLRDSGEDTSLVQSDGGLGGPDDRIALHVSAGSSYQLFVTSLTGQGGYTISTTFTPAAAPGGLIAVGNDPRAVVSADFNGDGVLDLVTANPTSPDLSVLLGTSDATFRNVTGATGTPLRVELDAAPVALAVGDFNHDGKADLAVAALPAGSFFEEQTEPGQLVVLLGNGDGTFRTAGTFENPGTPRAVVSGDFNGDGNLDLATVNGGSNAVLVFLGDGTGQFEPIVDQDGAPLEFLVGGDPTALVAVQLNDDNGDGKIDAGDFLDLAAAVNLPGLLPDNSAAGAVVLLRGTGDGLFASASAPFAVGEAPTALVAAQLNDDNGDGKIDDRDLVDLVTANSAADFVRGDPNFRGDVSVLFGTGPGTFAPELRLPTGFAPQDVVVGDFNNDGLPDLATANHDSLNATVLLGLRGGTFAAPLTFTVGSAPFALARGDFDGDGRVDLAFANNGPFGNVSVLRGRGDGTFQDQAPNRVGATPRAIVTADFNNDNRPDVATANADGTVSILLGQGDGTFQLQAGVAVKATPRALAAGDFNRDGRPDLVTANDDTNTVSVLLGVGDGTFRDVVSYAVGSVPVSVAVGQFNDDNGDGVIDNRDFLDIVTADSTSKDVSLLLGNGDGTFRKAAFVPVGTSSGSGPIALVVGQFSDDNGDGVVDPRDFLDVAVVGAALDGAGEVTVLLGSGKGTFTALAPVNAGNDPTGLVALQFDDDGFLDLAVSSSTSEDVVILPGDGRGHFGARGVRRVLAFEGQGIAAGDFNGDGRTDIAISSPGLGSNVILLNLPPGSDADRLALTFGESVALAVADFNGDGLDDLAGTTTFPNTVLVELAALDDDGFLEFSATDASRDIRATPILVDINGDGLSDSVVVARDGRVLLREGNAQGTFDPPVLVNPGQPARAVVPVHVGNEVLLAATDQFLNPATGQPGNAVTLYRVSAAGRSSVAGQLTIAGFAANDTLQNGSQLTRIVAADLNADGVEDLAVLNVLHGHERLSIFLGDGAGGFQTFTDDPLTLPSPPSDGGEGTKRGGRVQDFLQVDLDDTGPVDLVARDVTGDGFVDLVLANQLSGVVTVLVNEDEARNSSSVGFGSQVLYLRAGDGPFGEAQYPVLSQSQERTSSVAVADFTGDGILDVVAANPGTNSFALLMRRGSGSFADPIVMQLAFSPALVVTGQFNDDNGDGTIDKSDAADLAFLNAAGETVSIFLGDGRGGFTEKVNRDAAGNIIPLRSGNSPTGISVADVNGDNVPDLQVGNAFGDVLTLLGNGDGTFQAARRADRNVPLATADFNGDGVTDALVVNSALDQLSVQLRVPGTDTFTQANVIGTADAGLQAPVAPVLADLNGDGLSDMVVANSGGNTVTVFLRQADGSFVTRSFFAGTGPAGIAVRDLNNDGVSDLIVANRGSNDVSILFGQGQGDAWTLITGPRIRAGNGPISADVIPDTNNDGLADLRVVNGQDGNVSIIPGRGKGFFDDTATQVRSLSDPASGGAPVIEAAAGGFLLTDSGAILSAATGATVFFDATRQVRALDPFVLPGTGGLGLVIAFGDGSLSLLTADANGSFSESQVLADTGLIDPSAVEVFSADERLEVYITEGGNSVPFVRAFDLVAGANGPDGGETGPIDEAGVASVAQTQAGDSNLFSVPTLLDPGRLGAALPAVQGPSTSEAPVAPDVVIGVGDVLNGVGARSGSGEDSAALRDILFWFHVNRLVEGSTEAVVSTVEGIAETIAQAAASAVGPLAQALEALQVKDVPLPDAGLVGLAAEIAGELASVGSGLASEFVEQFRQQLKVEAPPAPGKVAETDARGEQPARAPDAENKADEEDDSSWGRFPTCLPGERQVTNLPHEDRAEASEPDAEVIADIFQGDRLMATMLTSAVFATGFLHRPQRDAPLWGQVSNLPRKPGKLETCPHRSACQRTSHSTRVATISAR